jgi:hypothetical protein
MAGLTRNGLLQELIHERQSLRRRLYGHLHELRNVSVCSKDKRGLEVEISTIEKAVEILGHPERLYNEEEESRLQAELRQAEAICRKAAREEATERQALAQSMEWQK